MFLFVNLAFSKKLTLPLAKLPSCLVWIVYLGITLWVVNLPASLTFKPEIEEGKGKPWTFSRALSIPLMFNIKLKYRNKLKT